MESISIIIPTYKSVEYLKICLESIYRNQFNPNNEVVVVVDGTYNILKDILNEYKTKINLKPVILDNNVGFNQATNYGFYLASNILCLNINDDNVCPKDFDKMLLQDYHFNTLLVPNQIEPFPSMFHSFLIVKDLGISWIDFNLNKFTKDEIMMRKDKISEDGWTFPLFINKYDFLKVGGLDVTYPGSFVSDWELFMKLEMCGVKSVRTHKVNFYHFGGKSSRTPESIEQEKQAHLYFKTKWGKFAQHNPETNSKLIF